MLDKIKQTKEKMTREKIITNYYYFYYYFLLLFNYLFSIKFTIIFFKFKYFM